VHGNHLPETVQGVRFQVLLEALGRTQTDLLDEVTIPHLANLNHGQNGQNQQLLLLQIPDKLESNYVQNSAFGIWKDSHGPCWTREPATV